MAEECIAPLGNLAKAGKPLVVPANLSDLSAMIALATQGVRAGGPGGPTSPPA